MIPPPEEVLPIIRAAVAAALRRWSPASRAADQEIDDLTQEVAVPLLVCDGGSLLTWDPSAGLPFPAYVKLLTRRHVASILRSRRRAPWTLEPVPEETLDQGPAPGPGVETLSESRRRLFTLLAHLRAHASPRDVEIFEALLSGRPPDEIAASLGIGVCTVYAVRSRIVAQARAQDPRELAGSVREAPRPSPRRPPGARRRRRR